MAKPGQHERERAEILQTSYIINGSSLQCHHNHNTQITCYGISAASSGLRFLDRNILVRQIKGVLLNCPSYSDNDDMTS